MTTTMTPRFPNQVAGFRQLVLFPELVGMTSVPLESCEQGSTQGEEQGECRLSLEEALAAGQMLLW
ncbi:MAG: hypothetical protein H0U76_22295 [Ktedonobacteraceae bacterium]|nr:hypothetical protein [Ktedonobacteraceae bacterium]